MDIKQNGSTKAEPFHIDKNIITEFSNIFQGREDRVGILKGRKPDGKKNQWMEDKPFDAEMHLNLQLLQGLEPTNENGECKFAFVDVDQEVDTKEFCQTLFNLDPKAIPAESPSGRWHVFKIYNKWFPRSDVAREAKELEEKINKIYKVDKGHTLPVKGGWCNVPYARFEQFDRKAYDPRGFPLSLKQFIHRVKFKNHPLIAAAAGMEEDDGRHKALFNCALYCEHVLNDIKLLNEINDNFADPCAAEDVERFTVNEYHKTNEKWTKQYLDNNLENYFEDINGFRPEIVNHLDPKFIQPLEVYTYKAGDQVHKREWIVKGTCMPGAVTLFIGPGGAGKTTIGSQLCYSVCTGLKFFNKDVFETGNVLMLALEETLNEMKLKLRAIEDQFGSIENTKNKIDFRTIEQDVKLVHFKHTGEAEPTADYHALNKRIQKEKYKLIWLDPLVSLKTGAFDENDNEKMEQFIKNNIIPIGVKNHCALAIGHHTNKISGITYNTEYDDKPTVDNLMTMYSARGASSLTAAARLVFGLTPMSKYLWETHYSSIAPDGVYKNDLVGLIEAKSNYSGVSEEVYWLEKNIVAVDTLENTQEQTNVFTESELTSTQNQRLKKHEELNKEKILHQIHHIKDFFKLTPEEIRGMEEESIPAKESSCNSLVEYLAQKDPEFQNKKADFKTIKSRYDRLIKSVQTIQIPNTKLEFVYSFDAWASKVKHVVEIKKHREAHF